MINDPEPIASGRAAAGSGICFFLLFVGGLVPIGELLGSFADSDRAFEVYFADSGNRAGTIVGGILLAASALVFLWFLQHLRQRLQPDTTRSPTLPNFVYSTGQIFVTLLLVGTAALVTVPVTLALATVTDDRPFTTGQAVLPQLGYVTLALFANWTAAAMVLTATIAARQAGSFPRLAPRPRLRGNGLPGPVRPHRRPGVLRAAPMDTRRQHPLVALYLTEPTEPAPGVNPSTLLQSLVRFSEQRRGAPYGPPSSTL